MKRTLILLPYATAALLLAAACQADLPTEQDGPFVPDLSAPIELSGSAAINVSGAVTRADNSTSTFKLYAVPIPSSGSATTWSAYINGTSATLASGTGTSRKITFTPAAYWPIGGQSLKFIGAMNANGSGVTVNGSGTITLTPGTSLSNDILLSNNLTGHKVNSKGEFTSTLKYMQFNRLMAKLIVKPGTDNRQVVTCKINGGSSSATYNVLTGASSKSGTNTISYTTNSGQVTYYLIPGTGISQLTEVTTTGNSQKRTISLTSSSGNGSFTPAAGHSYTIEVTADYARVTVNTNSSIGWGSGGDIDLN